MDRPRRPNSINPSHKKKFDLLGRQSSTSRMPANEQRPSFKKRHFRVMTFRLSFSIGAKLRPIEISGVLFAVLKRRVLQKRHRPPPDKSSGLSSVTALCPHEYKKLTRKFQMSKGNQPEKEEHTYSQTSRLEKPEEPQLRHMQERG
jgi:hypothetical protein